MPAGSNDSAQTTRQFDNPAAAGREHKGPPSPAQVTIREATEVQWSVSLMLVPPPAPRYLLVPDLMRSQLQAFDLLQPSGPGVTVLHGDEMTVATSALSEDGGSICLGCMYGGGLRVYDTAPLLVAVAKLLEGSETEAGDQVAPRGHAPNLEGHTAPVGAVFSPDASRLFVLWRSGAGVTVHDPWHPNAQVLRTLPFTFGPPNWYSNYMLACAAGLLAAAAGGGYNSPLPKSADEARARRKVQLWRVNADGETELRTVDNPDLADSVAISPSGELIAVGLRNGMVRFLTPLAREDEEEGEKDVYVEPEVALEEGNGEPVVQTLCFSHDGSKLVAGRAAIEDFTVYDVASAAVVSHFMHPKSEGTSVAFFPADDVLVTGTFAAAQPCVFHRLLPAAPRFEWALPNANIASSDITWSGELGPVVALAADGSQLSVHTASGKMLLQHDLGTDLFTGNGYMKTAVRMQPGGKLVGCVLAKTTVVVVSVADGSELLRVATKTCNTVWWSPDGALLGVPLGAGVGLGVFSADEGFAEVRRLHERGDVSCCAFNSTGTQLATDLLTGRVTVWEVATWTPTHTFEVGSYVYTLCFSNNGDRLAYNCAEGHQVGVLSLEAGSHSEPQMILPKVNAGSDLSFSPDDNFLLCCPAADRVFDQHRMRVLDLATGADANWGDLLRTMALPVAGGTLCGRTLGWAQLSQSHSPAGDSTSTKPSAPQWVLYGAVGTRLVATDIDASLLAIQDNAWTSVQLDFCSRNHQQQVGSIVKTAPHCSNIRDKETGETVLHRLMRAQEVDSLKKWLKACSDVTPVVDHQGLTAVQVAVQEGQIDVAQAQWHKLPSSITSVAASLLLQELRMLSEVFPHLVLPFLLDIEPTVVRTVATFRTELTREVEVCGLPTATLVDSSDYDNARSEHGSGASTIPSIWSDKCLTGSAKQLVATRVVVLPDLLGDADASPFHDIVQRCDASAFDSKLLELIVQYKWENNVRPLRMRSVAAYGCACMVGAVAMVVSSTSEDVGTVTFSTADSLQGLVVAIELLSLCAEAFQLAREGLGTYCTGPWNILDVVSSSFMLVGSAYHFVRNNDGVRTAGALGVALKCFGLIDYVRSFSATGSLVRMIAVILTDMIPFMIILSFAMLGCTMFFVINQSSNESRLTNDDDGLFRTLIAVYHMSLGIGQGIDTSAAPLETVMVTTSFTSFVVVILLNLLIAIMGDSYEKVKESERVEALRERAWIIVEMERRHPKSHQYHRFMHFLEAADSSAKTHEKMWEGVTKRVTEVMRAETRELDVELNIKLAEMKSELNTKIELLDNKLDGGLSEMNTKLDALLASVK